MRALRGTSLERATRSLAWASVALALFGCQGTVLPADEGNGPSQLDCEQPQVAESPLTHLTRSEYDRTVADLLGLDARVADGFAPDENTDGFEVGARVSPLLAEQYVDAAEALAERAVSERLDALLPCDPAGGEEACARAFIEQFGMRAFRRPLGADEVERFLVLYRVGREDDFATGIQLVIQGALSAPSFLYHVELEPADASAGDVVLLDEFEMASRLSYFLWASMPDEALFAAASAGELRTPEQIEEQARRMLEDERAVLGVRNFTRQWLGLDALARFHRDPAFYPDLPESTGADLRASIEAFMDDAFFGEEHTVDALLLGRSAYVNAPLASLYGIEGVEGDALVPVELDATRRAGLLTQPGLLAVLSKPNQSDPIHRGLFVRNRLLCEHLPPPPADVVIVAPDPAPGLSTRERFAEHTENPRCQGCHRLIDPLGFGFEHYDALGRWRDTDEGVPVDASGEVVGTDDADGPFDGVPELAAQLAGSDHVRECIAIQWFRYAVGRTETARDTCSVQTLNERFRESGYDLRELLVSVVRTDAFRHRRVLPGVGHE